MQQNFLDFIKEKIETEIDDKGASFCRCLTNRCAEAGLTNTFKRYILDEIAKSDDSFKVGIPKKNSSAPGFFGYKPQHADLFLEWGGKKVLIECKTLKNRGQCDIRNAFSQLLEYLLSMEWDEGCVLIFDIRQTGKQDIFTGSGAPELNKWFVHLFSNQLPQGNPPLGFGASRPNGNQGTITAVRVYADHGKLRFETCP